MFPHHGKFCGTALFKSIRLDWRHGSSDRAPVLPLVLPPKKKVNKAMRKPLNDGLRSVLSGRSAIDQERECAKVIYCKKCGTS
jgi:hypothetical protein